MSMQVKKEISQKSWQISRANSSWCVLVMPRLAESKHVKCQCRVPTTQEVCMHAHELDPKS